MWVLDAGNNKDCPAQLLSFDLKTDRLIKRVKIPVEIGAINGTILTNPVVETNGEHCEDTWVNKIRAIKGLLFIF